MVCRHFPSILGCLILLSSVTPAALAAKTRHKAPPRQDRIEVVSRLPLNGAAIARFLVTQHYRRDYLYAEASDGKTVTLIDVSDVSRPAILAEATPSLGGASVVTAAGTAVLMTDSGSSTPQAKTSQTFRIMSFADPAHPVVSREFPNVTAIGHDDERGLIFLADPQGIWILHETLAMDPAFEKEWEHMMLDNR